MHLEEDFLFCCSSVSGDNEVGIVVLDVAEKNVDVVGIKIVVIVNEHYVLGI